MSLDTFFLRNTVRKLAKASRLLRNDKFRHGLRHGVAATIEHQHTLAPLNIRTVVDVGANIGQFSLLCRVLFPAARIYAFEPQLKAARRFAELFTADAPVTLFRSAIGVQSGQIDIHVSRRHDSSSLLPISRMMTEIFPGTDEIGTVAVSIGPLITFISAEQIIGPALLKIDVQGTELEVLKGCDHLLNRFRYIYAELSFIELYKGQSLCSDVIRFLDQQGFHILGINNLTTDKSGRAVQADFLFQSTA
jgi:FkbM family methyltransferase